MSDAIDRELVAAIVREALAEIAVAADRPSPMGAVQGRLDVACEDPVCRPLRRPVTPPFDAAEIAAIKHSTPARVAQGRTGTRYLTSKYIGLRAEHAIALDAVLSEVPDDLPGKLGCLPLKSRASGRQDYLLNPDHGRRLDDESRARLEKEGTRGADVQIICGDGLAAWALIENGPALLPALVKALEAERFTVGKPVFVRFARIGVQDEIGTILGAKSTVIMVGERPGLGSGDSLSLYTAYKPKLAQDNAEKDCISNIRALGIPPLEAAKECATLLRRSFAAGGGGTHLVRSGK
jgi:ethanolamine ammonia-lyase small subunit